VSLLSRCLVAVGASAVVAGTLGIPGLGQAEEELPVQEMSAPAAVDPANADQYLENDTTLVAGAPVDSAMSAAADAHMASDVFIKNIFGSRRLTVRREGPWKTQLTGVQLGVIREVTVAAPFNVPTQLWPSMRWDKTSDTFIKLLLNKSASGVSTFYIFIDAAAGVIGIAPVDGTEYDGGGNLTLDTEPVD
jgi:hypothetical protein